jgi:hypothetical protein
MTGTDLNTDSSCGIADGLAGGLVVIGRWSEDEKLKIVVESLHAPRQVAATARRYGISRSLLLRWRRSFRPSRRMSRHPVGFVPAMVVASFGPFAVSLARNHIRSNWFAVLLFHPITLEEITPV